MVPEASKGREGAAHWVLDAKLSLHRGLKLWAAASAQGFCCYVYLHFPPPLLGEGRKDERKKDGWWFWDALVKLFSCSAFLEPQFEYCLGRGFQALGHEGEECNKLFLGNMLCRALNFYH